MSQSALQGQIAVLPPQIEQLVLQEDAGLDPKRVAAFRKAMAAAFAADTIQARARDFLQARLGREDVEQMAQWYSSPLGKRIRDLELKADKPGRLDTYAATQGDLAEIVGAERLKRIERIASAVQETEAVMLWAKHAGTSVQKTRLLVWGVDLPLQPWEERIAQMRPTAHRVSLLAKADTLRGLAVEDLDRYVTFAESPAARRWHRAMWDALDLVMAKGMEEVIAAMPRAPK